ncbi:hypothetical protein ABH923_003166 [Leifsonia sp. EB41]
MGVRIPHSPPYFAVNIGPEIRKITRKSGPSLFLQPARLCLKAQPIQFMMFHPLPTREGAPNPDAPFPG